jgi:hypothetical protein
MHNPTRAQFSVDSTQAQLLQERLDAGLPDSPWLTILQAFEITGCLDTEQLQAVSNLQRMQLTRLLDKLESFRAGLPPILHKLEQDIRRPGARGRTPKVYLLGESGAALLRLLGKEEAHACGLNSDTTITHALAMVDVHLSAKRAQVELLTDQVLNYGERGSLRPDHQIPGEKIRILEIEQAASLETLRRLVTSLEHKLAFFESPESAGFEKTVSMLLQLPHGPVWERTLKTWQQAIQLVEEKTGKQLNFRLQALSLQDFLRQPGWNDQKQLAWPDLTIPGTEIVKGKGPNASPQKAPTSLMYRSTRQDKLVLAALWQNFENLAVQDQEKIPMANPEFLLLVRLIHSASHDYARPALELASLPHASLYLLQQYLKMHPVLRERIQKVMHFGKGTLRWNSTTILHRMQVVINAFLGYHGWRSDGGLLAFPAAADWNEAGPRTFTVLVRLRDPELLMLPDDNVVPSQSEIFVCEEALAWVLWALFNYAPELGLGRVEFW